jgi:hypothetical protein
MIPALASTYFAFQLCASPGTSRFFQSILFALACAALPMALNEATGARQGLNAQFAAFNSDLNSGMSATALVQRHGSFLNVSWTPDQSAEAAEKIRMLHRAGVGVFRSLKDEPASNPVAVGEPVNGSAITRFALGSIDRFNELDRPPASTEESPFVLETGKPVTILGWIADRPDGAAFDDVYVAVNSRQVRAASLSRPDVAAHYKNPALLTSGFSAKLTPEDLGKGLQRIDIVGSRKGGGDAYRLEKPVYVEIR